MNESFLLQLRQLSKSFVLGQEKVPVFSELQMTFQPREVTTIQGASGSGKTTLLHLMAGLDVPDSGEVLWMGKSLSKWSQKEVAQWRREKIGFVFQAYHLLPELTALENVELPSIIRGISDLKQSESLLEQVGLSARKNHRPSQLSGGEQQRVAIARALRNRPELVLADEPTGNLDRTTGKGVMEMLLGLCRDKGTSLIMVTHDATLAALGDRKLLLSNQQLSRQD